jgi:ABC-2 type transport system ATP-binding protein
VVVAAGEGRAAAGGERVAGAERPAEDGGRVAVAGQGRAAAEGEAAVQEQGPLSIDSSIETKGLTKRFGDTVAVDGVDLRIPAGMFYGLLGPNGAGKSTMVSLLTGTRLPSVGTVRLLGQPMDPDDPGLKAAIGVVTEEPPLFERLTGEEQLVFTGRMYGLGRAEVARRTADLLELLGLSRARATLVADYSRGMRKKLAIGCALVHNPRILFFDEPFEGVDALSSETIRQVLARLTEGGATVLLTTHILTVAERICQRVGILHRGRLAWEGDLDDLRAAGHDLSEQFRRVVGTEGDVAALPGWLGGGAR